MLQNNINPNILYQLRIKFFRFIRERHYRSQYRPGRNVQQKVYCYYYSFHSNQKKFFKSHIYRNRLFRPLKEMVFDMRYL